MKKEVLTIEKLTPLVEKLLEDNKNHEQLGISYTKIRNCKRNLHAGKMTLPMMLDLLNRGGKLKLEV